jgi:hypothetical protein
MATALAGVVLRPTALVVASLVGAPGWRGNGCAASAQASLSAANLNAILTYFAYRGLKKNSRGFLMLSSGNFFAVWELSAGAVLV